MTLEDQIKALLDLKFQEEGHQDLFLVDMKYQAARKKLEVFIDSDSGLDIQQCSRINRYLQHHIDEAGWLGEKYILDVSSPGVSRPLKLHRQYLKNIGRKLEVYREEQKPVSGILKAVDEEGILLEVTTGKKKKKVVKELKIPFEHIVKAIVRISF